jgi:hypothetical protein
MYTLHTISTPINIHIHKCILLLHAMYILHTTSTSHNTHTHMHIHTPASSFSSCLAACNKSVCFPGSKLPPGIPDSTLLVPGQYWCDGAGDMSLCTCMCVCVAEMSECMSMCIWLEGCPCEWRGLCRYNFKKINEHINFFESKHTWLSKTCHIV